MFSLAHLALSGFIARALDMLPGTGAWLATAVVLVLLAGIGALPIFGIAHGRIQWTSAYEIYGSGKLR